MTVASAVSRITVAGNGAATSFAFPFKITSSSHLVVTKTTSAGITSTLTEGTHYSVTGVGSESGGSITYPLSGTPLPSGDTLTMRRIVPLTQTTDLTNQGPFYAEVHESVFDTLTFQMQQLTDQLTDLDAIVDGLIGDTPGALRAYSFTGDGATVLFPLGVTLTGGVRSVLVAVDGVLQNIGTYAVSGTSLLFSEPPPYASVIDVRAIGEAYSMTLADTSLVVATGTTASRSLSDRFADVYDVKNFEATGNGTSDDSVAFLAAFAAARTAGGGVIYIPPGVYNLASMTASVTLRVFSGCTVRGEGYANSIIKWNDDDGISLFRGPTSGRCTDVVLEDFAIRGTQDTRGNAGAYPLLITSCDNLHVRRLLIEKSRVFGMAVRSSRNVTVQDCVVRLCGRDGINVAQATRYIITGNQISNCDDDAIAAHSDPSDPEGTPNGGVITGNTIFDAQGIKVLGARHCVIADNTLDCCKAQGITVTCDSHDGVTQEGVSSALNIIIANNKITNTLDRTAIDALNAGNNYINIGGAAAQAGTLNAVPGENYPTGGTIIPYYDYLNNNSITTTSPTPGSNGIIISNNILSRTLKGGAAFSTYRRGLIFCRGGWYDPTFTAAQIGQSTGITISSGYIRNVSITGNVFSGLSTGVGVNSFERLGNVSIRNNTFWDILSYGVLFNPGTTGKIMKAYVEGNIIDMDPLHSHSNRGANGTWLAQGNPTGIQFQSGDGGVLIRDNIFRNLCRDTDKDSSAINTWARWERNYVEADPTAGGSGSFSTSNKGVGIIRRDGGVGLIHTDSDPASATYGQILTPGSLTATAMPSTGTYLAGAFVRNTAAAVSSTRLVLGWHRLTTGSAHVLGTDWAELGIIDYPTAGVVSLSRTDTATNGQLSLTQVGTGDTTIVLTLSGVKSYAMGIDNSDSDKLKIGTANNGFSSGVALEMNTSGDITLNNGNVRLTPRATAPSSPAEGMLAYADGSGWNPGGTGAGVYCYISAAWVKL